MEHAHDNNYVLYMFMGEHRGGGSGEESRWNYMLMLISHNLYIQRLAGSSLMPALRFYHYSPWNSQDLERNANQKPTRKHLENTNKAIEHLTVAT